MSHIFVVIVGFLALLVLPDSKLPEVIYFRNYVTALQVNGFVDTLKWLCTGCDGNINQVLELGGYRNRDIIVRFIKVGIGHLYFILLRHYTPFIHKMDHQIQPVPQVATDTGAFILITVPMIFV